MMRCELCRKPSISLIHRLCGIRRPRIYFHQFLLLPVRILVGIPYFIILLLVLNVLKALTSLSGVLLVYGVLWVVGRFVWPSILDMPTGVIVLLVIVAYVGLSPSQFRYRSKIEKIGPFECRWTTSFDVRPDKELCGLKLLYSSLNNLIFCFRILERKEPIDVQALIAKAAVEGFE
jgi:hypothetical protein